MGSAGTKLPSQRAQVEQTMQVTIARGENTWLGLMLQRESGSNEAPVKIIGVEAGAVTDWNAENPSKSLRCGDQLISVNGAHAYDDMLEEFRRSGTLDLVVQCGDRTRSVVRRVSLSNADWVLPQCIIDDLPHVDAADCF